MSSFKISNKISVGRTKFNDLPGWSAESISEREGGFRIYDDRNHYVAYYSETFKQTYIIEPNIPDVHKCKNLHQAMRFAWLKLQTPKL